MRSQNFGEWPIITGLLSVMSAPSAKAKNWFWSPSRSVPDFPMAGVSYPSCVTFEVCVLGVNHQIVTGLRFARIAGGTI